MRVVLYEMFPGVQKVLVTFVFWPFYFTDVKSSQ